jgi:endonuclease-3
MKLSLVEKQKRSKVIRKKLTALYPHPEPPLHYTDAYTLLVAVALSAQTTDVMVNKVTPGLFALANTPEKMAKLPVDKILEKIKGCNYSPTKAKNLKAMAEKLVDEFHGKVPQTFEELESLPGVGHKTASVVMSQFFGFHAFPVDTHIHRLAKRWGLSNGKSVEQTEHDLKALFPESYWHDLHLQMIYYGREHCTARGGCDGKICPLCSSFSK